MERENDYWIIIGSSLENDYWIKWRERMIYFLQGKKIKWRERMIIFPR